jgi:plastocyanin
MTPRVTTLVVLAGVGAALAGCGGAGAPGPSAVAASAATSSGTGVTIKNFAFQPRTITVPVGMSITWTNQDSSIHTVTANDRSFNSGNLTQGQRFSHAFSRPGTYAYHCDIHQYMTGSVIVTG